MSLSPRLSTAHAALSISLKMPEILRLSLSR
jgi:hypothetical protein